MLVFVKLPSGKTIPIEIESADKTIQEVKNKISEREAIGGAYKLVYKGKPLSEEKTVGECEITKEATIHLAMMKAKPAEEIKSKTSTESTAYSTSKSKSNVDALADLELSDELKAELLSSFALSAESSAVEIVFSFDTTGSMSSCLGEVRSKVSETCARLMKDIPEIRIGIIAHGDYCDGKRAIEMMDFCGKDNVKNLCNFVQTVGSTGGGDAPEAYELALRTARKKFSWTKGWSKALVVIGDEVPHPPSFTTKKINWKEEVTMLAEMGVKIYGVRALNCNHAIPFYEELSERTGTVSIKFNSFKLIVDMFLAICYREASPEKLQAFEEEIKSEGKMTGELTTIFQTLSQPNPEKKTREATEKKHKCNDPWYVIEKDNGSPQFEWDKDSKQFVPFKGSKRSTTTTTTTSSSSSSSSSSSKPSSSSTTYTPSHTSGHPVKVVFVCDAGVGKTTLIMTHSSGSFPMEYIPTVFDNYTVNMMVDGKPYTASSWDTAGQEDYDRLRPLSYPNTDVFVVLFSVVSPSSFANALSKWKPEITHHCPGVPLILVGTKVDLREDASTLEKLKAKGESVITPEQGEELAKKMGAFKYVETSSLTGKGIAQVYMDAVRAAVSVGGKNKKEKDASKRKSWWKVW